MSFMKEEFHFKPSTPFSLFETNASQVMIHCHDCLEINYIVAGSGHYIIEDKYYPIKSGDLFLINNAQHHMAVHDGSLVMTVFVFDAQFVWGSSDEYDYLEPFFTESASFSNRITSSNDFYRECTKAFEQIADEYLDEKAGYRLLIKALLMMFLGYLNRSNLLNPSDQSTPSRNYSYDKLRPVVEYIHANYARSITLDELAEVAMMNPSYLSTCFTQTMKIRIFEYIEQVRINHAKLLLKTTPLPITEIAFSSGFNNSSYFNRIFKRITGTTPLKYRKESKYSSTFTE